MLHTHTHKHENHIENKSPQGANYFVPVANEQHSIEYFHHFNAYTLFSQEQKHKDKPIQNNIIKVNLNESIVPHDNINIQYRDGLNFLPRSMCYPSVTSSKGCEISGYLTWLYLWNRCSVFS